jgi:hypothetical protein
VAETSHPPKRLRASTTVHLASVAHLVPGVAAPDSGGARLDQIRLLDEILDVAEGEPSFRQLTLTGGAAALEDYVSLRPEHYERIERAVRNRRLLVGPWYLDPRPPFPGVEITLRNLHLGAWTCRIFGRAVTAVYLPRLSPADLPGYLPQLLRGFGVEALIVDSGAGALLEGYGIGDDGTRLALGSALDFPEEGDLSVLRTAYGQSLSQSALLVRLWMAAGNRADRLVFVQRLNRLAGLDQDEIIHSSPESYAWALRWLATQHTSPPEIALNGAVSTPELVDRVARLLVEVVEPLAALAEDRAPAPDERFIRRPQAVLRRTWQRLLHALALGSESAAVRDTLLREAEDLALALAAPLGADAHTPSQLAAAATASQGFRILATKLPEDGARRGLLVRGVNPGAASFMVSLRPWRRFAAAHVMGLDELPTGGTMATDGEGAIHFRAAPNRLVSFWFSDEAPVVTSHTT